MPKEKTITVYQLSELEGTAKQRALNSLLESSYSYEWWDSIYDDAKTIGLKITSFDLDRGRHAKGSFTKPTEDVIEAIRENHGKECETYKTAISWVKSITDARAKTQEENATMADYDDLEEKEKEFLYELLEDYSIMLQKESEYMSSEEYLTEMAEANEYEFDVNGKRV